MPVRHPDHCNRYLSLFISQSEKRKKDEDSPPESQAKG